MVFSFDRPFFSYYQEFLEMCAEMFEISTENGKMFLGICIGLAFLLVLTATVGLIKHLTVFVMEIVKMGLMVLLVTLTYEVAARALGLESPGLVKYWSEHLPLSLGKHSAEIKFRNFYEN